MTIRDLVDCYQPSRPPILPYRHKRALGPEAYEAGFADAQIDAYYWERRARSQRVIIDAYLVFATIFICWMVS